MRIVITGTPGVGKTTLAHGLSKALNIPIIRIEELIGKYLKWDPVLNTNHIINPDEASKALNKRLGEIGSYILDTVAVELLDPSLIDWCVVLRLNPKELITRLRQRGWPWCKVVENVFAEILGASLTICMNKIGSDHIIEIDTTGKSPEVLINEVLTALNSGKSIINTVDWLESLDSEFLLSMEKELDSCYGD